MSPHTTAHARAAAVFGAALALVALTGCTTGASVAPTPTAPTVGPTSSPPAASSPVPDIPRTTIDTRSAPPVAPEQPPARVAVASLGIDMPVVPVGLDPTGDVTIPSESHTAGWYRYSSGVSATTGSIVVVAHVDAWDGIGPFSRLKDVAPGAEVVLTGDSGARSFRIDGVAQPQKAPGSLKDFFVETGPAKLVLITCGGVFDDATGHYRDNVIVTATPLGP